MGRVMEFDACVAILQLRAPRRCAGCACYRCRTLQPTAGWCEGAPHHTAKQRSRSMRARREAQSAAEVGGVSLLWIRSARKWRSVFVWRSWVGSAVKRTVRTARSRARPLAGGSPCTAPRRPTPWRLRTGRTRMCRSCALGEVVRESSGGGLAPGPCPATPPALARRSSGCCPVAPVMVREHRPSRPPTLRAARGGVRIPLVVEQPPPKRRAPMVARGCAGSGGAEGIP